MPASRRPRSRFAVPAALGALALASAAPAAFPAPADRGAALVQAVERARTERARAITTVRADVVIGLASRSWQGAGTCQGRLAAVRPGSLRLLGYAAVATVFDATSDGDSFWLYLPQQQRVIAGRAAEESLLVALPVLPGGIVTALFGDPYGAPSSGLRAIDVGGSPWVAWDLPGGHEVRARYRTGPTLLERAELWDGGRRVARLDYRDYRKRHGTWWPTRIEFDWPEEQGGLTLAFDRVSFGEAIAPSTFRFAPPPGVTVVPASDPSLLGEGER